MDKVQEAEHKYDAFTPEKWVQILKKVFGENSFAAQYADMKLQETKL